MSKKYQEKFGYPIERSAVQFRTDLDLRLVHAGMTESSV
jgi:hypothetical protein